MVLLTAFAVYKLFISPTDDRLDRVDVIMVLAGGLGDRLDKALTIVDKINTTHNHVDVIVSIGNGQYHGREAIENYCKTEQPADAQPDKSPICFELKPEFDSTRGETSEMTRLAEKLGHQSLAVISSDYHILRSRLWFKRCFKGDVRGLSSRPIDPPTLKYLTRKISHEILAIGDFLIFNRQCWTRSDLVRDYR